VEQFFRGNSEFSLNPGDFHCFRLKVHFHSLENHCAIQRVNFEIFNQCTLKKNCNFIVIRFRIVQWDPFSFTREGGMRILEHCGNNLIKKISTPELDLVPSRPGTFAPPGCLPTRFLEIFFFLIDNLPFPHKLPKFACQTWYPCHLKFPYCTDEDSIQPISKSRAAYGAFPRIGRYGF